jgi:hypothetical protein
MTLTKFAELINKIVLQYPELGKSQIDLSDNEFGGMHHIKIEFSYDKLKIQNTNKLTDDTNL